MQALLNGGDGNGSRARLSVMDSGGIALQRQAVHYAAMIFDWFPDLDDIRAECPRT
ncbi:hypothetical protein KCP75_12095 [Salmonella enterica subsp. enterica]|nr:hypothetical protein KCP75_12095 [Salmonella enterica subsp. enterica]